MSLHELFNKWKMSNAQYMKIDDIIAAYPDGIHLSGVFTRTNQDGKEAPCFKFAEEPERFFYASTQMLQKMYSDIIDDAEGNILSANEQLSQTYIHIRMERGKSKSTGNPFLFVYIIAEVPAEGFNGSGDTDDSVPF